MGEGTKRPQVGGGKRGSISAFTGASRRRFLWKLAGLRNGAFHGSLFITLTYPVGEFSPRQQKRHLDLFLRRLRYMFPDSAGVWKLEYTERDEAHFHILLLGVGYFLVPVLFFMLGGAALREERPTFNPLKLVSSVLSGLSRARCVRS